MAINLYRGFSTFNRTRNFRLKDIELVKQDLINHFSTRKGERLMYPNFGTTIWDMIYEPFDSFTKERVREEVQRVVNFDPRLTVDDITVIEFDLGLQVSMNVTLKDTNETEALKLKFDRESAV